MGLDRAVQSCDDTAAIQIAKSQGPYEGHPLHEAIRPDDADVLVKRGDTLPKLRRHYKPIG
jgi:hypothetical protein